MSALVERLADLTGYRDRDVLDVSLAAALRDLLRPQRVAIYRAVGDAGAQHWLTRAHLLADSGAAATDSAWAEIESLPRVADTPDRARCLHEQVVLQVAGPPGCCLFPLASDRETVGVLEIEREVPLNETERRLVLGINRVYGNFLALLDYSERDTLTGLLNRKTFDESFMKTAAGRAALRHLPGTRAPAQVEHWLGVIDIDHFKRVNDTHGHLIGDEVLLLLARLMRASFRLHDRLYRFGGEEFVVLLRCAGEPDALVAFERLRRHVERYAFPQVGHITVSIGFTHVRPSDNPADAFARADEAVYHAKEHGRNQVASHAELVQRGLVSESGARHSDVELF